MIIIRLLFLKFIFFSFGGYILECIYSSFIEKRINFNRGFFIGPYCPIYGVTLTIINYFKNFNNIFLIIIAGIFITLIEYFTAYILEKIFNKTWWDYSRKKYNVKGRICLENIIIFSIGSTYIIKEIVPLLDKFLGKENYITIIISFALFMLFAIDFSVSSKKHYMTNK